MSEHGAYGPGLTRLTGDTTDRKCSYCEKDPSKHLIRAAPTPGTIPRRGPLWQANPGVPPENMEVIQHELEDHLLVAHAVCDDCWLAMVELEMLLETLTWKS